MARAPTRASTRPEAADRRAAPEVLDVGDAPAPEPEPDALPPDADDLAAASVDVTTADVAETLTVDTPFCTWMYVAATTAPSPLSCNINESRPSGINSKKSDLDVLREVDLDDARRETRGAAEVRGLL
jgi:hypothetical protein